MASLHEIKDEIRSKLLDANYPQPDVLKYVNYLDEAMRAEATKDKKPVSSNSIDTFVGLFSKFHALGLVVDGTNVVISGKNMAMVTYHGYKNKVLETYPESEFDLQLVREGDTFSFSKDDGKVHYSHQIANPFDNKPIIGAYSVIKNKRGEFLELLNKADFEEMAKSSKMAYLWKTWASEFWLKSVMKRACKRHFNDIVAEIDKVDNEDYGQSSTQPLVKDPVDFETEIAKLTTPKAILEYMGTLTIEEKRIASPLVDKRIKELNNARS